MLEMYASNDSEMPVEVFAGHTDVVKEFVWRKGGPGELYTIPLSVTNYSSTFCRRVPTYHLVERQNFTLLAN